MPALTLMLALMQGSHSSHQSFVFKEFRLIFYRKMFVCSQAAQAWASSTGSLRERRNTAKGVRLLRMFASVASYHRLEACRCPLARIWFTSISFGRISFTINPRPATAPSPPPYKLRKPKLRKIVRMMTPNKVLATKVLINFQWPL